MAETSEIFRELVLRYEESVREKQKMLIHYREQMELYTSSLEREISEDQERLDRLRAELASIESYRANRPAPPSVEGISLANRPLPRAVPETTKRFDKSAGNQSQLIRSAARDILSREGRPLMQSQLNSKMLEMGLEIMSRDPKELIRSALKGGDEFRHIRGQGWTLANS